MARLKEHFDLIAILLLIAVLGIGHAPMLRHPVQGIRLEHPEAAFRMQRLDRLTRMDRLNRIERLTCMDRLARTIPFIR